MKQITETRNQASRDLDLLSTEEILRVINREDESVPAAVRLVLPALARAVDETVVRLEQGGRVFYVGAGTSGRLGVLDASEMPPTFGVPPELFQGVLAGGYEACHSATEVSEDDPETGARDLRERGCGPGDVVVGLAASGRTPYAQGAIEWAESIGALTIAICCNPDAPISRAARHAVTPIVGPEILSGSTRMKSGTAQKLVLNMFSTALMVRLGHVFSNWMIHLQMKNSKLRQRGLRILAEASGRPEADCRRALDEAGRDLKVALAMLLAQVSMEEARRALASGGGNMRRALEILRTPSP